MDVAHYSVFRHHIVELVAVLVVLADEADKVEVTTAAVVLVAVVEHLDRQILQLLVVELYELVTSFEDLVVSRELGYAESRENVGHITFILCVNYVVFPRSDLVLGVRVLGLAVEREEHVLLVHPVLVDRLMRTVNSGSAFRGGHVLYGVEAEIREVRDLAAHLALAHCAESVRTVGDDKYPAELLLQLVLRFEHALLTLDRLEDTVVVADDSREVNRDDRLCVVVDRRFHLVVVHLKAAAFAVDHNGLRADVIDNGRRGGVCIGRKDNLVAGAYSEDSESQLRTGGLR